MPVLLSCYVIALPFAIGIIGKSFIVADIFLLLLIGVSFYNFLLRGGFRANPADAGFLLLIAASLAGKHVLAEPEAFAFELASLIFMYVGARVIAARIDRRKKLEKLFNFIASLTMVLLSVSTLIIFFRHFGEVGLTKSFFSVYGNFKGLFNYTNQMAILLVCFWPFFITRLSDKPFFKLFWYFIVFSVTVSIGSRSGFWVIFLQTALIELMPFRRKKVSKVFLRFGSLIAVVALTISLLATDSGLQRSLGDAGTGPRSSNVLRVKNFREALNSAPDWLRGYGLGCFDQTHVHEVHNTPFSVLVETGVVGFMAFIAIFAFYALKFYRSSEIEELPNLKFALSLAWLGLISMGMFHYLLRNRSVWLIVALTIAFITLQAEPQNE